MFNYQQDIPLVSKPEGNVDDCNPVQWLHRNYPGILDSPERVGHVLASIEKEDGRFLITTYRLLKTREKYLKVCVHWEMEVDGGPVELWSTLYTNVKCPVDSENVRDVALAKAEVLMLAETYCESLVAVLDKEHERHILTSAMREKFKIMTQFFIEVTPTGRVKSFTISTREKDAGKNGGTFVLQQALSPYFAVSRINDYESGVLLQDEGRDKVFSALNEEREGKVSHFLIDYYTACSQRYSQTFEEAYSRFIDVMAEQQVQRYIHELKEMEAGEQEREYSIDEIREKFDYVMHFVKKHHEQSRREYEVMNESFANLEALIDKFESWREHPDLSLAQTSLLEDKINELSRIAGERRFLLAELKRRFEKIEYWAKWFQHQFPTLFSMLDE